MSTGRAKSQPRLWAAAICALAGAALFQFFGNANHGYIDTNSLFWWWTFQWWNPGSETEHGWLILGISAWLLWRNVSATKVAGEAHESTDEDQSSPPAGSAAAPGRRSAFRSEALVLREDEKHRAACAAMLAGLALHAVGFAAQQARVSILALLLFTWGIFRLGGGRRWGAAAVFPLAFLVFAIPINVLDSVGFWLRLWVIRASSGLAHGLGVDVVQSGTQLMAPDGRYNYDVAAACSGVRSLMALAALSLLIGYLRFHSWWRRGLLLLLCFPLVYVGNIARISMIVFAAQFGGPKWGDAAHTVMGWGIFVIVLGGVLAAARLLERVAPEKTANGLPIPAKAGRATSEVAGLLTCAGVALVVVIATGAVGGFLHRLANRPPRGQAGIALAADGRNPVELPALLGRDWVGWPAVVTAVEREMLPPDTGYARMNYVPTRGTQPVFLSVVLSGGDRTSIHRPELCLVGQGWTITGQTGHQFLYPGIADASFPATVLHVHRPVATSHGTTLAPQLVVYWFVGGDGVVATHWERLARDAWNRVIRGRVDRWAYVLMQTDASDGDEAAFSRLQSVLNATLPVFQPAVVTVGGAGKKT